MSYERATEMARGRKRMVIEIGGYDEFVETPDGTFKIASPIWERGMHEVEYVPGEPLATATRLFGERFRQGMIAWLQSTGHAGATETTMADGLAIATYQAIAEVAADIEAGALPCTAQGVTSFAQLHDYVDANGYGGGFDWDEGEREEHGCQELRVHPWHPRKAMSNTCWIRVRFGMRCKPQWMRGSSAGPETGSRK
jgi:hypothetical protein